MVRYSSMKQVIQSLRTGETMLADVPVPTPKPGAALVRTAASLVSAGTERMLVDFAQKSLLGKARSRPDLVRQVWDKARREGLFTALDAALNRLDRPMPLGYSSAGTVVALGEGLEGFRIGDRVACAGGGYAVHAEYAAVPRNLLARLPEDVDFESAAFATLGAIALHGFRLAEVQLGERVAVIGLGLLGLLSVQIARAAGCEVLGVDLDSDRVARAARLGALAVPRADAEARADAFSRGRGVDAVLICADTPSDDPVHLAGAIARDRARVVAIGAVGFNLPRKLYYEKELTFLPSRSYGPGRYDPAYEEGGQDYPVGYVRWTEGRNLESFVELLAAGRVAVQPLITHRFPIERAPEAYDLITGKTKEPFMGVLLTYGSAGAEVRSARVSIANAPHFAGSTPPIKLGVIGAGNFATAIMLPAIRKLPDIELVGIASASGLSARHAAKQFGARYAASDEKQLLKDPDINTVAILTRHDTHARLVVAALQAGKHVFCEKPLAVNSSQLAEVREQLLGSGKREAESGDKSLIPTSPILTVGFNRRFAPLAQRLQAFFANRAEPLYAHYRVNAGYLLPTHWLHDPVQGGGRIVGEACHFVDFLAFLVGQPPAAVSAVSLPDGGRYRADNVQMTCTFSDGSVGTVAYLANGDKMFPKERVEVFCEGRVAVLDDFRMLELVGGGRREVSRSRLRQDKGHRGIWEAFVQAIIGGGPPPISYEHLLGVAWAVLEAVER